MSLLEELKDIGVDTEEGLYRLMGNAALYERMLIKLLDMLKQAPIETDFNCDDYAGLIERTHAIKGAAGNLSVTPLYKAYSEIVCLLRSNQPELAKKVLKETMPIQNEIMRCIERYS